MLVRDISTTPPGPAVRISLSFERTDVRFDKMTDEDRIDLMEQAYSSVDELCSQLDDADWEKPTDLPGWSVKDNLSHLVSYEAAAIGRPPAPPLQDPERFPYIKDEIQAGNEREVEWRRSRSGAEVLAEFREVGAERLAQLRNLDQSKPMAEGETPIGLKDIPWARFLPVRVSDFFYHEQDMRRAVGKPGHMNGAVAKMVFERMSTNSLPRFAKWLASVPDGGTVAFDVEAPGRSFAIKVTDGKGETVETPSDPSVRISSDFEAFLLLIGGRRPPSELIAEGRVRVEGEQQLVSSVLEGIAVIP
jgi:uncharacterized protein (TIGR03083 family)